MPFYTYVCPAGCRWSTLRPAADRDKPLPCTVHLAHGQRVYDWSGLVTHVPRSFFTSWYDVHTRSPRELARDPNIDRYDPSQPHKPYTPPSVDELRGYMQDVTESEAERAMQAPPMPPQWKDD